MAPDAGTAAAAIDEAYEFSAPRFFDFINEETEEAIRAAESWFEAALSYAPSPFHPRIKESRAVAKVAVLCDFTEAEEPALEVNKQKEPRNRFRCTPIVVDQTFISSGGAFVIVQEQEEPVEGVARGVAIGAADAVDGSMQEKKDPSFGSVSGGDSGGTFASAGSQLEESCVLVLFSAALAEAMSESPRADEMSESPPAQEEKDESPKSFAFLPSRDLSEKSADGGSASTPKIQRPPPPTNIKAAPAISTCSTSTVKTVACTPKTQALCKAGPMAGSMSVKKSVVKGGFDLVTGKSASAGAAEIVQENQAVKKQRLDDGRARQILNVKTRVLPHKGRADFAGSSEMRRTYEDVHPVKEVTPYVSAAELVKKFESGTRKMSLTNRSLSHEDSDLQGRPKLMLTRPKEPELQTSHRVRAVRVKSSAELEEEMLAKIPKFRARPFNKKIAEAPKFPPLPRKPPQVPEFNEFHLKTMERATRYMDTCSEISSADTVRFSASILQSQSKPLKSTQPKPPQLHTAMRARPPSVKSSQELELEELEKAPKFRAKPLNKKILESKGDIGVFAHPKPQVTAPKEFRFSTDVRLGPPSVADLFDKIVLQQATGKMCPDSPNQTLSIYIRRDPIPLPEKERKPLTEVQQFALHVDERAVQRSEFDNMVKEKEKTYKRLREENEFAQKIEEEKALKQLRRSMVPHARPLPKFDRPFRPQK
ncbi:hypothetical protein HU200_051328 [Digitaria exilis]|uniref:Protein TPX2 n=1 Tax=Digitaria exilis TaxID=1010633 RepID=A0A835E9K9_9POAL|nr:hypothetical protein HU200_051328 [Digitaria exilis]